MIAVQVVAIVLAAALGTATALVRDPFRQSLLSSLLGMLMICLFMIFQAPDPALSVLAATAVGSPVMVAITLAKVDPRPRGD